MAMDPKTLAGKYDRIAAWWNERHFDSDYGVKQLERALGFAPDSGRALDVGCGSGGRFVRRLEDRGFSVIGIDVSAEMIRLARENHPGAEFIQTDICHWDTPDRFDFILGWDSLFHLPFAEQAATMEKLCGWLAPEGVIAYTFGDAVGEHEDQWQDDSFYYSSIGINHNLRILDAAGLVCRHLIFDQWPHNHVFVVAQNRVDPGNPTPSPDA